MNMIGWIVVKTSSSGHALDLDEVALGDDGAVGERLGEGAHAGASSRPRPRGR
jgi:hypothetical protein